MTVSVVLRQLANSNSPAEWQQAWLALSANVAAPARYEALVAALASTGDNRIAFWSLDLLIKYFTPQLAEDAPRVIPLLLDKLTANDGSVADRAAWALSNTGKASVQALVHATRHAASPRHRVAYLGALRSNKHLHLHAKPVLALLANELLSADADVRYWAMVALMDISPLRTGFDSRMNKDAFEPLYPLVLEVARELVDSRRHEFALRYQELIECHLAV